MRAMRMIARSGRRRRPRRRPQRQTSAAVDARLLQDVEHLAEVVAETIGRLHKIRRSDIARPLEDALERLGGRR